MKTSFDPDRRHWNISWPGRVAKHDLVYLSPPGDPTQGIPLGNGDVGTLCWCEGSKLILAVNKSNLWEDAPFERFHNWKADQEERNTTLRHACRFIIDFKWPVFDSFYLNNFEARLNLADATMTLKAKGPFGSISVRIFVHHHDGSLRCRITTSLKDATGVEVTMERFGSRTFAHWYSQINRDAGHGLKGTTTTTDKSGMYIQHTLTSGTFAVGARIIGHEKSSIRYTREHSHAVKASIRNCDRKTFGMVAVITSPGEGNARKTAEVQLKALKSDSAGLAGHRLAWKQFWLRSFMEFGDDYLDNLWHLAMYYANASQRGTSPGRFLDGLWGWNRDFRAWNFYFHWNQQQLYWPLNAAGHHDLIDSYLEYRFNALPYAKQDAKELFNADGAFVSDVCDRRGYNSTAELLNHTPVAQIALDFYRQYQYTGDEVFLRQRALPYLIEAATFFESLLEKEADGLYHAKCGTAYEGWTLLKDSITELACAKSLFDAVINACSIAGHNSPRLACWQDIIDHLAPLPIINISPEYLDSQTGTFSLGLFKTDTPCSDNILCCGKSIDEQHMLSSLVPRPKPQREDIDDIHELIQKREAALFPVTPTREDWVVNEGLFPWSEFATVFPAGPISLSNKQSEEFKAAVNTAKLYSPAGTGWDPLPIVLARLGLSRELTRLLTDYPDQWQIYVNGFTHWGIRENIKSEASLRFYTFSVADAILPDSERAKPENKFPFPAWPFRHASLESMYVLATALNEALLQSHDGIIRVAPAAHNNQHARFTLHATGGFVVSSEINAGKPAWIFIHSLKGAHCRIRNPWEKVWVFCEQQLMAESTKRILEIPTSANQTLLLAPRKTIINNWHTHLDPQSPNSQSKRSASGRVGLGLPRMF